MKSVDLKYHKIRDYVEKDGFALVYCPLKVILASILTKPVVLTQLKKIRQLLNVVSVPTTLKNLQDIRDNEVGM